MSKKPPEVKFPISSLKQQGVAIAAAAQKVVAAKVKQHATSKSFLFVLKAKVVPSTSVKYRSTQPADATKAGKAVGAIAMYFEGTMRIKVDVKIVVATRKIAAVETRQMVQILIVPQLKNGQVSSTATVTVIQATASKERQGKQSQANALRDMVKKEIVANVKKMIANKDLLPAAVRSLKNVSTLTVTDTQVVATLGAPGTGYAKDAAKKAAKAPPKL